MVKQALVPREPSQQTSPGMQPAEALQTASVPASVPASWPLLPELHAPTNAATTATAIPVRDMTAR